MNKVDYLECAKGREVGNLGALGSPAMGQWGHVLPLHFQLFNFSGHFRAAQTLKLDYMWLPIKETYITGL